MPKSPPRPVPRFRTPIVETHCHLDYLPPESIEQELEAIVDAGVERIVTIAVSPQNLATVLQLAEEHQIVWCTQGIHPHEAALWTAEIGQAVRTGARSPRVVAIGEIGLDYYYEHADRDVQRAAFEQQLQIAADLELPIVVHTRDAEEDTRAILSNHVRHLNKKGVIHSFTSSQALADYCIGEGFSLGFNGICTFKNADNVRAVISQTPVEQILLETDAPYLTPVPYRGRTNSPRFLPLVAEQVAALKQLDTEQLLRITRRNSMALFFPDAR